MKNKVLKTMKLLLMSTLCVAMLGMTGCGNNSGDDEEDTRKEQNDKDEDEDEDDKKNKDEDEDEDEDDKKNKDEDEDKEKDEDKDKDDKDEAANVVEEKPSAEEEPSKEVATAEQADEAELIVGTWGAKMDIMGFMLAEMEDEEEFMQYFDQSPLYIVVDFNFGEDGLFEASINEDSFDEFVEEFRNRMVDTMTNAFQDVLEQNGMAETYTVEDLIQTQGYETIEGFVDEMIATFINKEEMTGSFNQSGYYKLQDGKLYTSEVEDINESDYEEIEWDNADTFVVVSSSTGEADFVYPITFERK